MTVGESFAYLPEFEFRLGDFQNISTAICIPACRETTLIPVLDSIAECSFEKGCMVVLVINGSELLIQEEANINLNAFKETTKYIEQIQYPFPIILKYYSGLPQKKAGVGLARKLAMDCAVEIINEDNSNGLLLALDADCKVAKNYITECLTYFSEHKNVHAASIYFEHPMPKNESLKDAIWQYELHLRYLKNALKWAKYPWYFHTVGSAMAVRSKTYKNAGGMNTRQAGEDFYFLHKLMPLGFGEILKTTVYPEARFSDRVPFGTGRSMLNFEKNQIVNTYAPEVFVQLRILFQNLEDGLMENCDWTKGLHAAVVDFWESQGMQQAWQESKKNTSNIISAQKRLLLWFSGFAIVRYLNHASKIFPQIEIAKAAEEMFGLIAPKKCPSKDWLKDYRQLDKGN